MKKLIFPAFFSMMLLACNHLDKHVDQLTDELSAKPVDSINTDSVAIGAAPVLRSTNYFGILPCADCKGIETDISLKSDNTYSIHTIYQARKSKGPGSNEFNELGNWMLHGTDTVHLMDRKYAPSMFIRTDSSLVQLDMKGRRITGKLADKYILKKSL